MTTLEPRKLDSSRSWLIAASAATSTFVVFGVAYSFGAFFASMAEEFGSSSSATALFFSITISLSFVLGLFTGRWVDRVGPKPVIIAGAVSLSGGLLLTTLVPSIWLGYLTYGVGVGFAVACGYVPMVATVGGWFDERRSAALGLAVAGIGLGTLVGSPIAARIIDATSWRTAFVVFAIVGGTLLLLVALVVESGPAAVATDEPRPLGELLGIADFRVLYISSMLGTFGLFVPFVFLVDYAKERDIGEIAAAALVGLIGGFSVIGRLGLGALADRVGIVRLFRISFAVMACSHVLWLLAGDRYPVLVLYTIVLGVGYGGFIALGPAVLAERFGLDGLGGVIGTLYTSAAVGSLFGPPIAGVLIDAFSYPVAISFGLFMSLAALLNLRDLNPAAT